MSAAADVELLGLYWTVSGPVEVHFGREWSLFDWADRCAEARKVGFSGLGIWHADLQHSLETRTLKEMKEVFDANGLTRLELEFIMDWFLDGDDERRKEADKIRSTRGTCRNSESPPTTFAASRSNTSRGWS